MRPVGDVADVALDVVIVNWNTGDCLRQCLASLRVAAEAVVLGSVVVVDNDSSDASADDLGGGDVAGPAQGLPLTLIRNQDNRGFAAACNQGVRECFGDVVLFLNPDTVLEPDTLRVALTSMLADPRRGIVGGALVQADGTPAISASHFPSLVNVIAGTLHLDRLPGLEPRHLSPRDLLASRPVDQVIGAFFLIWRPLFDLLGGFDERYFLYYEEVDLAARAAALGWTSYHERGARLQHVGNVSARASGGRALFHSLHSRSLYARRHWGAGRTAVLVVFTVLVEIPLRLLRAARTSPTDLAGVARASALYVTSLRSLPRSTHP